VITATTVPRWVICYEKVDERTYPVLPLTGTLKEIENELRLYLSRHPELSRENFQPYRSVRL
jgi:hypothetical protein